MTTPMHTWPLLLLMALTTAVDARPGNRPGLLPAGLMPAGLRLQATFAAVNPDQGMAVFGQEGQTRLRRAGSDLGNGLQLLQVHTNRVVLAHGGSTYYLPLRSAAADERRPVSITSRTTPPGSNAIRPAPTPVSGTDTATSGGRSLQAGNLDEVRQQCQSSTMAQLSAAQRQEVQALGLCP